MSKFPQNRAGRVLRSLHYDFTQFDLDHFIQAIEQFCQKPIVVLRFSFDPDLHGVWIPAASTHYMFINAALHPVHQIHIVLHELAHIALDHPRLPLASVLPDDLLQQLGGDPAVGRARYTLRGSQPRVNAEQEAETFVLLVQQRVLRAQRLAQLVGAGSSIDTLLPLVENVAI